MIGNQHDPEFVKLAIRSQKLTAMATFDMQRTNRGLYHEPQTASPVEELCGIVDTCIAMTKGWFRLECWDASKEAGHRTDKRGKAMPAVFFLLGTMGQDAAPSQPVPVVNGVPAVYGEPPRKQKKYSKGEVETLLALREIQDRLDRREADERMWAELNGDDDDNVPEAPAAQTPAWMTDTFMGRLLDVLERGIGGRAAPTQAIQGAPASMDPVEMKVMSAFRNFARENPRGAQKAVETLLNEYGGDPAPDPAPTTGQDATSATG